MGRKKKRAVPVDDPYSRIFCYYCDRNFRNEHELLSHQREKHLRCPTCNKRMLSVPSLMIHSSQMHNVTLSAVPNAIAGRDSADLEVLGMDHIPKEYYEKISGKKEKAKEKESKMIKMTNPGVDVDVGAVAAVGVGQQHIPPPLPHEQLHQPYPYQQPQGIYGNQHQHYYQQHGAYGTTPVQQSYVHPHTHTPIHAQPTHPQYPPSSYPYGYQTPHQQQQPYMNHAYNHPQQPHAGAYGYPHATNPYKPYSHHHRQHPKWSSNPPQPYYNNPNNNNTAPAPSSTTSPIQKQPIHPNHSSSAPTPASVPSTAPSSTTTPSTPSGLDNPASSQNLQHPTASPVDAEKKTTETDSNPSPQLTKPQPQPQSSTVVTLCTSTPKQPAAPLQARLNVPSASDSTAANAPLSVPPVVPVNDQSPSTVTAPVNSNPPIRPTENCTIVFASITTSPEENRAKLSRYQIDAS